MTLTDMLKVHQGEPESKQEADANEWDTAQIKNVFKEWLKTVGLGNTSESTRHVESTRKLLILLVDEP